MDRRLRTHNEQIMLVLDDPELKRTTRITLSEAGYRVAVNSSINGILELIAERNADALILDICMLGNASLELLERIKGNFPELPIILVFDEDHEGVMLDALKFGVMDYMLKPLRSERLVFSVHTSLERGRLELENKQYAEELEEANRNLQERLDEIQADQQAGHLVQQKMLPRSPGKIFNYQFEHLILPANYLSGDFVDYHQLSDNKLVFFLVDVTGHGASSAFVTVLIKQLSMRSRRHFRMEHNQEIRSAAWMLGWINRNLMEAELECHSTIFLGVIDNQEHTLNYSYGGHFPQAIFASPDTTCYLNGRGLPLGLFEGAEYEDHFVELPQEFSITLMSDGVLEVMQEETLEQKEAKLLDLVAEGENNGGNSLNSIFEALKFDELDHPPDDISVLTIHSSNNP